MCLQKIFYLKFALHCIAVSVFVVILVEFDKYLMVRPADLPKLGTVRIVCGAYCFMFSNEDICKDTYQILGGGVGAVTILMWHEKIDWQGRLVRDTIYPGDEEGEQTNIGKKPPLDVH